MINPEDLRIDSLPSLPFDGREPAEVVGELVDGMGSAVTLEAIVRIVREEIVLANRREAPRFTDR